MPAEVRTFTVTTPAGTLVAAPLITALTMPARTVRHVRVRIPPGPNGQLGFALGMAGVPVIPTNVGQWIVGNDEVIEWDVDGAPNSGAWQLITYNLGANVHTLYVTFSLDLVQSRGAPALPAPLVIEA